MTIASRLARAIGLAAAGALLLPASALASPPTHSDAVLFDIELAPGEVCDDGVVLSNPTYRQKDTAFAPRPDGSQRFSERGFAASRATNMSTGAFVENRGGASISYRFAADGSLVVQGTGFLFAWYAEGDDSDLPAGLWLVHGRVTETYAADGTFIRATFSGNAIDACEAIGA